MASGLKLLLSWAVTDPERQRLALGIASDVFLHPEYGASSQVLVLCLQGALWRGPCWRWG